MDYPTKEAIRKVGDIDSIEIFDENFSLAFGDSWSLETSLDFTELQVRRNSIGRERRSLFFVEYSIE